MVGSSLILLAVFADIKSEVIMVQGHSSERQGVSAFRTLEVVGKCAVPVMPVGGMQTILAVQFVGEPEVVSGF